MKLFNFFKRKKEKSIEILNKSEIEKEAQKLPKKIENSEPSWYHYVIVLLILGGIIGIIYGGFEIYERMNDNGSVNNSNLNIKLYKYSFTVGDKTYNIEFYNPIDQINKLDYPIQVSKYDLFNSKEFYLSFYNYNGTDNGEVVRASGRVAPFLKSYGFVFDKDKNFVMAENMSCENSTLDYKVIMFNPYSDKNGVFYNSTNGCIIFETDDPKKMGSLGDKFLYTLINE